MIQAAAHAVPQFFCTNRPNTPECGSVPHAAAMDITLAIEGRRTECGRDPQDGHALTRGVPARNVERAREVLGGIKAALKRQRFA